MDLSRRVYVWVLSFVLEKIPIINLSIINFFKKDIINFSILIVLQ